MALNLDQKKQSAAELRAMAETASSLAIADFSGVSVEHVTALRRTARTHGVALRVVKNRVALRGVEGTDFACAVEALRGSSLLGFSYDDPGACARLFRDFAEENESFKVRALVVNGDLLDGSELNMLADLPTQAQALMQLLGILQAPMAHFHGALRGVLNRFVYTLSALREQREQPSTSPSEGVA